MECEGLRQWNLFRTKGSICIALSGEGLGAIGGVVEKLLAWGSFWHLAAKTHSAKVPFGTHCTKVLHGTLVTRVPNGTLNGVLPTDKGLAPFKVPIGTLF